MYGLEETVTEGMVSCMLQCRGVVFAGLVILASSPYFSELLTPRYSYYIALTVY